VTFYHSKTQSEAEIADAAVVCPGVAFCGAEHGFDNNRLRVTSPVFWIQRQFCNLRNHRGGMHAGTRSKLQTLLRERQRLPTLVTLCDSSSKKRWARERMRASPSCRHTAILAMCPLTFIMSFRMRCVSTISAFFRTPARGTGYQK